MFVASTMLVSPNPTACCLVHPAGQRFMMDGAELPPMWQAEEAAANLIKVSNKAFESTLIQ
jgi:hypothetical protein